ncbi:MAG TPA: MerR family transcriptional regulator [Patescibacteria group bacterium]|nr:MerR family transcriptional regulator [Patescibacteria group bacterium]
MQLVPIGRFSQISRLTVKQLRHYDQRRMGEMQVALSLLESIVEQKEGLTVYEVKVKEVPEQPVLMIRTRTTMAGIAEAMGRAFGELMAYQGRAGIAPAGPPLCVYAEDFNGETGGEMWVCVPAPSGVTGEGRVETAALPGGTMATTIHRGPYDTIGQAYAALFGWIEEHGHHPAGPMRDVYLTDPDEVPPEEYLTEVLWPIA